MKPVETPIVPVKMEQARQQVDRWRRARPNRSRIPEPLWTAAVELARQHGIYRTARTLRLDYTRLKARLESARRASPRFQPAYGRAQRATAFVELIGPPPGSFPEGVVELEGPRGRMRIALKGIAAADLVALSRALWKGEA
jgi:hypothetical protein